MGWEHRVSLARATQAPFGVGSFHPGVCLLIGEQASHPDKAPEQLPFCSDKGCSGWLNRLLAENGVQESKLFWVNALNNDGTRIDLPALVQQLRPSRVIALGGVARKLCVDETVEHEYCYHPQYWKRFRSKHRYPLLDLLQLNDGESLA